MTQINGNKSVLIVDDDANVLQLLEDFLKSNDFNVSKFTSGVDALVEAKKSDFDFCILDMDMPKMSGVDVCHGLRAIPKYKHTPILFLTMNSDSTSVHRALEAGGSDFLSKPIVAKLLWHRISLLLKIADLTAENANLKKDAERATKG
jgi:DNA-binding response OmpR family regulator